MDQFFTTTQQSGELNSNASGFVGQYAHGNEPSHHVAYLYNYAGQPWKTQQYVAHILTNLYNNSFSGYAGNDDCGEMSAWYIFSAMGFYPVNPANGIYVIGCPLLEETCIQLPNGKQFTVKAPKRNEKDIYIQSARLNGKNYNKTYLSHEDILKGGTLEFKMGDRRPAGELPQTPVRNDKCSFRSPIKTSLINEISFILWVETEEFRPKG